MSNEIVNYYHVSFSNGYDGINDEINLVRIEDNT
jgi:hypothetical protein